MIDWVTVEIPLDHSPIATDRYIKVSADGTIEYESLCRVRVPGSFESTIGVKSCGADGQGRATHLHLDGNPSKFLQGHNVFGTNDFLSLVRHMAIYVCGHLGLAPTVDEVMAWNRGEYRVTRVDINESFELDTLLNVRSWLKAAELKSKTRHGRPTSKGGTVYWGQHSRRWALKAYCKYDELHSGRKHELPASLRDTDLPRWAETKLRIELVLRQKQLTQEGVTQGSHLTVKRITQLFNDYLGRLEMSRNVTLSNAKVMDLPRKVQSTYMLWSQGIDVRSLLPKTTFYAHRKCLVDHGIDINMSCDSPSVTNVVPLLRVLEARPVGVPDWAYKQGLVFDPYTVKPNLRVA